MTAEEKLVNHHVLYAQNYVVEELFKQEAISFDSIHNFEKEVLEWWLVSDFLGEYLKELGETVIEDLDCFWWGRTCSGQCVYKDTVMRKICESFTKILTDII